MCSSLQGKLNGGGSWEASMEWGRAGGGTALPRAQGHLRWKVPLGMWAGPQRVEGGVGGGVGQHTNKSCFQINNQCLHALGTKLSSNVDYILSPLFVLFCRVYASGFQWQGEKVRKWYQENKFPLEREYAPERYMKWLRHCEVFWILTDICNIFANICKKDLSAEKRASSGDFCKIHIYKKRNWWRET